jgi:hypothetical protein
MGGVTKLCIVWLEINSNKTLKQAAQCVAEPEAESYGSVVFHGIGTTSASVYVCPLVVLLIIIYYGGRSKKS